jgi:cysteine desulfurase family protein (TIGR01976 family)
MENAGGSYVPESVINKLNHFMIHTKVQPYGLYQPSIDATQAIEKSTCLMAEMINATHSEVVIGHCTTMNLVMLSLALKSWFMPSDEIIVTNQDHESNISPWRRLAESGQKIIEWKMNSNNAELDIAHLESLLSNKTKLVCMTHSSNIVASVNDIKKIADLVHANGALLLVDGVSYAPHHSINVKDLNVDFYVLSLYKTFGPHLGLLYVDKKHHDKLTNQSLEFMPKQYEKITTPGSPNYLRIALNPGGVNHEEAACLSGLTDYYRLLHGHHFTKNKESVFAVVEDVFKLIADHQAKLSKIFIEYINENNAIKLIGKNESDTNLRSPTFAFTLKNKLSCQDVVKALAKRNIAAQAGSFYAWRCLEALGINPYEGLARVSFAHYNTENEVHLLCQSLNEIL